MTTTTTSKPEIYSSSHTTTTVVLASSTTVVEPRILCACAFKMGGPHLWHNYRSIEIILYYDKKDKWLATYVAKKLVASIASASGWI